MIPGRTEATRHSIRWRSQLSEWFSAARNSRKIVPAGDNSRRTPAGSGMFGLLVSSDAARGRWF